MKYSELKAQNYQMKLKIEKMQIEFVELLMKLTKARHLLTQKVFVNDSP